MMTEAAMQGGSLTTRSKLRFSGLPQDTSTYGPKFKDPTSNILSHIKNVHLPQALVKMRTGLIKMP